MCTMNPRVDFVFKKLFGSENSKEILMDLINAIVSEKDQVADLVIKNPYNEKQYLEDKRSVLDIKAQSKKGTWYDIETLPESKPLPRRKRPWRCWNASPPPKRSEKSTKSA